MALYDSSKPVTSSLLSSAELRNNWDALQRALGGVNLLADPRPLIWAAGDSAAPAHYSLSGTGATIARETGASNIKYGPMSAKLIAGAGLLTFQQQILPAAAFKNALRGFDVSGGKWIKCSSAASARYGIYDGVGTTYSAYHTGGGAYEWLSVTRTLDVAATQIVERFEVTSTVTAYAESGAFVVGSVKPLDYIPPPIQIDKTIGFLYPGDVGVVTAVSGARFPFYRPTLALEAYLVVGTAPTGLALICDFNKNGTANSLFTTKPQIAISATTGSGTPDGTYANRCFTRNDQLSMDIDQKGSTIAGADLTGVLRFLQFARPLEDWLGVGDVN